jgi:site-specific DNA-methyltransferase (adenine-specific)
MARQRTTTKSGVVYDDGQVSVQHGTAANVDLPDESAACIVTSPPYNVGVDYDGCDDQMTWSKYRKLADATCTEMYRLLMPGGRAWVNVTPFVPKTPTAQTTPRTKKRVHLSGLWADALTAAGFDMWDTVAWVSQRGNGTAWGSWESPSSPNLRGDHEIILVAYKTQWYRSAPVDYAKWRDPLGGWPDLCQNVWRITPARRDTSHPAPFPAELARRAIRLSTWPDELVVDPFCGTGTTLAAARELGRRAHGVDLSKNYCLLAATHLQQRSATPTEKAV